MNVAFLRGVGVMGVLLLCCVPLRGQVVTTHMHFPSDDHYKSSLVDESRCCWGLLDECIHLRGKVYRAKPGEKVDLVVKIAGEYEVPEMYVGIVKEDPDECGLWQWVNRREDADFSVRIVKSGWHQLSVRFFEDGDRMRTDYGDMKCEDWSTGRPRPCKKRKR